MVGVPRRCRTSSVVPESPGRHRVAVAREGDAGVVGHDPLDLGGGRERRRREGEQRLGVAQRADGGALAVRSRRSRSSPVVAQKTSRERWASSGFCAAHGAPPAARDEAHRGLDRSLAVAAPGRTGLDDRPVVLGHRGEGGLDVTGSRARSPWPGGRSATPEPCRRGAAAPRPWPRSRWAWSIFSASTPRTLPECDSVPNST